MYTIIKIAKNELRNLFYSPIAWFLSIIFLVMCGFYYTSTMYPWAKTMHTIYQNKPSLRYWAIGSATAGIFSANPGGFFARILQQVYLFPPLLTMGIISREFNNGTIKLLYSSPIKLRQIVLGKFLAILTYNLILVLIIGIFIISAFFDVISLDYGPVLSGTLGFFLLLGASTAIGFFMSGLTSYQIVSAVASFTLLFILNQVGGLWQQYDFVRDLTYFLSIKGRTEKMILGLVTTKDVIYYCVIIYMFICFTLIKLKSNQESRPLYMVAGRYLAVAISGILIGYISSRPQTTGYLDTTARKVNTIHPRTQKIIGELNGGPLEVTLYVNLFDPYAKYGMPESRNNYLSGVWEPYQRFKRDMEFRYEYYYALPTGDSSLYKQHPGKTLKQIVGLLSKLYRLDSTLFKSPEEMRRIIDLEPEEYRMVMRLKYKDRAAFLRTSTEEGEFWPSEQNTNAVFKRLLGKHIPKVYYITGQLERNILKRGEREFFDHTINKRRSGSLINIGFDIDTLNLFTRDIPADATIIVLADPRMDLPPLVSEKLRTYVMDGGNMIYCGEPRKQHVLNPLLSCTGIQLMGGQLVQPSSDETPDKVGAYFTPVSYNLSEEYWFMLYKHVWSHNVLEDSLKNTLVGATGVATAGDSGFTIKPLMMTFPGQTWTIAGKLVTDSTAPVFNPQDGDVMENSFPVAIQLSRQTKGKEQRIIVCGDADMASNMRQIDYLVRSLYAWLSYNEFPVYTPLPYAKDYSIALTPSIAGIQKTVYLWVLPGLLLLTGTVLLIRRKRK
jgi:gliding motility-associated transport system permease protein/gliding motility-associatede transport system auxiliary component